MRTQRGTRPRGRGLRPALLAGAAALGLLLASAGFPGARASFFAITSNSGASLATDQLQPPSSLSVTQSCTSTPAITNRTFTYDIGITSVSASVPSGTTTGDVMLAQIAYPAGAEAITAPSGWTLLMSTSSGTRITSAIYWKAATASEPPVVFSRPAGSTGDFVVVINTYVGARLSAPTVYGGVTGTGPGTATPSLTTTGTTTAITHFLTQRQGLFAVPASTSQLYRGSTSSSTTSEGLTSATETFAGPGAIPIRTSTSSTSDAWVAQSVVLRRVAGTPTANLAWTASTSTWGSGYLLDRQVGGSTLSTKPVPGVSTTSTTDGPLTNGTAYTFRLRTYLGSWRSTPVTAGLTTNC